MKNVIFLIFMAGILFAQITPVPNNIPIKNLPSALNSNYSQVPQKFFGITPPGSISGNLPGDIYVDTLHNVFYVCEASSGTSAPACTTVSSGQWSVTAQNINCGGIDDTTLLSNALSALSSGGILTISNNTCVTASTLDITTNNISIQGLGSSSVIQAKASANLQNVIKVGSTLSGFLFKNFVIDGNKSNLGTTQGPSSTTPNDYSCLSLHGNHIVVDNVEVRNCQSTAIYFGDTISGIATTVPIDLRLSNSWIHLNGGTINSSGWGTGIYLDIINDAKIIGNRFESNHNTVTGPGESGAINASIAVYVTVIGNMFLNNFNVLGGQIATGFNPGTCGTLPISRQWTIQGNSIGWTTGFGGDQTYGIEICGLEQTIGGNVIIGIPSLGITTDQGSAYVTIQGNTINNSGTMIELSGDSSGNSHDIIVMDNTGAGNTNGLVLNNGGINNINVNNNDFSGATTPVTDGSTTTSVYITDNIGFNPNTSANGARTVSTSPWTYTAGHENEFLTIIGGTVSSVALGGTVLCSSSPCFVNLAPNQSIVITYSSAPTVIRSVN